MPAFAGVAARGGYRSLTLRGAFATLRAFAGVAELADAPDSKRSEILY